MEEILFWSIKAGPVAVRGLGLSQMQNVSTWID